MTKAPNRPGKAIATTRPVEGLIYVIRGQKVMVDSDLAELYGVETGHLNRAVKRNHSRFPEDLMFQLTHEETERLKCQIGISKKGRGGSRHSPHVFTEHGVAMLSSVLNSERAVQMNLLIVRTFIRLRELITHNKDLAVRVEQIERSQKQVASAIEVVIEDLNQIAREVRDMKALPPVTKRKIGFFIDED